MPIQRLKQGVSFILLLVSLSVFSQNNTFYRKYNLPGMQGALSLEVTNDGGFIATGQHEGNGSHGDCDIYVYKLDVCGNIEWFKIYGTAGQEGGKSIFQMNDGSYLVSGLYSGSPSTYRAFNMKIDATGNVIWIKRYNFEWMMYSAEAANGDIISIGRTTNNLFLIRTDLNGNLIWSRNITGMGDMGLWLNELPNGDIVFTSVGAGSAKDISAARLDAQGNFIWNKRYGGNGWNDIDHTTWSCKGVVDLSDNSLLITAPTLQGGLADENMLLTKVSLTNGSVLWSKVFGGSGRDQSRDLTIHPGGYAILGHTNSFSTPANAAANINEALGEKDILLFSVNHNGNLQWSRTYGGADRDKGVGVKFNNDNGFSISAFTTSAYFGNVDASFDPLFIKTDSVGFVGCQMFSPTLNEVNVVLTEVTAGTNVAGSVINDVPPINNINYLPNDQYVCQSCTSIPQFNISDTTVCVNDSVFFSNTTIVGLTCFQQWNVNGTFLNGQINPSYVFTSPGVYQIYLYSSCGLNSDTMIRNIYVIDPQLSVPDLICSSTPSTSFSANPQNGAWSGLNVSPAGIFTPGTLPSGFYNATYTIPEFCAVTDSFLLIKPPLFAGNDTLLCLGESTVLNASSTAGNQFTWNVNVPNAGTYTPNTIGVFPLIATITDTNGCQNTDTLIIESHPIPQADFTYVVDCYSTTVEFTNTSNLNPMFTDQLQLNWFINGTPLGNQNTITYDYGVPGQASASLTVESTTGGCMDTITQLLIVPTNPIASFIFEQQCDYIASFTSDFPSSEIITAISWTANNEGFGDNSTQPTYAFGEPGIYTVNLSITNDYPCTYNATQSVAMIIEESLGEQQIPNVITADSDGINDTLNLNLWFDKCLEYRVQIYNRWGNQVYEFTNDSVPFTGVDVTGKELVAGIYFYKVSSGSDIRHGHITLIR